jgi:hypothetical protein
MVRQRRAGLGPKTAWADPIGIEIPPDYVAVRDSRDDPIKAAAGPGNIRQEKKWSWQPWLRLKR